MLTLNILSGILYINRVLHALICMVKIILSAEIRRDYEKKYTA